jgi:metallo-beta-lactamase family protein
VKAGFRGRIIATPPTIDLAKIMLEDSAQVNEDDTKHENKRRLRMGLPPREPLYALKDVKAALGLFRPVVYDSPYDVNGAKRMTFRNAGHILGSAIIELSVTEAGKTRKLVFSGDLGQWDTPLLDNPTLIGEADYVLIESTYGDRLHGDVKTRGDLLSGVIRETFGKGGRVFCFHSPEPGTALDYSSVKQTFR